MKKLLTIFFVFLLIIVTPAVSKAGVVYFENFDTIDGNYAHGGTNDDWEWGVAGTETCWGTSVDGNYSNDSDQWLTVSIDLSSLDLSQAVKLKFKYWAYMSLYGEDHYYFEYSTDGGSTWNIYASDLTRDYDWHIYEKELTSLPGAALHLRWRLTSDYSGISWGLYIDDVRVEGTPLPIICEGDFDVNGNVDGSDLAIFAADFGRTDCP